MRPSVRIFKNSAALLSATTLERGVAFFIPWYIARMLGKEQLGLYSTTMTFVMLSMPVAVWGFDQLLLREIARHRSKLGTYLLNAGLLTSITAVVTASAVALLTQFLNYSGTLQTLIWIAAFLVIPTYAESLIFETAIKGLEQMEWIALVRFPLTLLRVGVSLFLLFRGYDLAIVFVVLALYYGVTCLFYFRILKRVNSEFELHLDRSLSLNLTTTAVPFVLIGVFGITFKQIDRVLLSTLEDVEAVGVYSAGATLVLMIHLLAPALMESLFPGLARVYATSRERFSTISARLLKLVFVTIVPVAFVVFTLAQPLVLFVYSSEYLPSVVVTQILAFGIVPAFLGKFLFRTILASDNERVTLGVAFVNSVVNIALNFVLIPRFGVVGASVAAVLTECTGFLQNLLFVHFKIVPMNFIDVLWKPSFCTFSGAVLYWYVAIQWSGYVALPLALLVFAGMTMLTGIITKEDLLNVGI